MTKFHQRKPTRTDRDQVADRIRSTVDAIPKGCVATYGQVAEEAGLPGRARLVGRVLRELPARTSLPWQRVIGAGGRIALDPESPGGRKQIARLKREGIVFRRPARIDMKLFGWHPE